MNFDLSIFRALNGLSGQSAFSDKFWIFVTDYLPYILIVGAFVALLLWRKDLREKIKIALVIAVTGGFSYLLVMQFFNKLWPRLRPFETLQNVVQLVPESGFSFPSKHAMLTFLLATYVYGFNKRLGIWLYVFAALVAISRVFVGVHYPSDILGGAVLGAILGFLAYKIYKKFS
ncbi:MAG TPA: phosphatase PAP2 family protein [Candidatus Paceibacterota bacterium]